MNTSHSALSIRSLFAFVAAGGLILSTSQLVAQTPPDLTASFESTVENWRATDAGATLAWEASGGNPAGYLRASGPGGTWHFVSPAGWAGDWSGYRALKFDLAIPSRHYADQDTAGVLVIVGANSNTMTWNGPTPLWTWTHYEVSLDPAGFGVDQATFDGIMTNVAELRILAEFTTAAETVGLDNVLVTGAPIEVHTRDLVERFTGAVKSGPFVAGWGPVDDVTLYAATEGQPLFSLYCDDWQNGQIFKVVSPPEWAGDWRGFAELRFDYKWTSNATGGGATNLLQIFGANGLVLTWNAPVIRGAWQHFVVPLTPASFGVDAATFESVMRYVSKIWILGEYNDGNDELWLDNIVVATGPETPRIFTTSLVSRFGADAEGWVVFDGATLSWDAAGGFTGGAIACTDTGTGNARFASPDSWSGDWRAFQSLRFLLRLDSGLRGEFDPVVSIVGFNGQTLSVSPPPPYSTWCPYTLDLTPSTFGVSPEEFAAVITNVAHVTITADLITGYDRTWLDDVTLLAQGAFAEPPPERFSGFDTDTEGWRKGGNTAGAWGLLPAAPEYRTDGNPDGCIAANDEYDLTYWFSPSSWAGDWRGHESIAFDLRIIQNCGSVLAPGTMLAVVSVHGELLQSVAESPELSGWNHYEFALTPAAFGVSQAQFDTVMRDAAMVAIRSEWIMDCEKEGLDNVRLSKAPEAYWLWLAGYLNAAQLGDEAIAGKSADADGDGQNNWAEYVAGTIPTDGNDLLRLERIALANPACLLDFKSKTNRLYTVEAADRCVPSIPWITLTNDIPGNGALLTVPVAAGADQRFFRLKARPSE